MLLSNWVSIIRKPRRLPAVRSGFRNELFHPFENFVGAVLRLNNRSPVFFADIYLCTRSNTETLSYFLRENDSPL